MYKAIIITLLLCIPAVTAVAQNNETDPYIEVNGSAEMEITPDIIVYSVLLREYEKDRKIVALSEIEAGFLVAVNASGIEKENIKITDVSASAFGSKRKRKAFASKTYNLTFKNPAELRTFTDRLENLDIESQRISKLTHSRLPELRLDVKKQAMLAAKNKAQALLGVVDSKLGKALLITEVPEDNYSNIMSSNAVYKLVGSGINMDDIGFKQIKLRFEIMARFRID